MKDSKFFRVKPMPKHEMKSKIEKMVCNPNYAYLEPYFYSNSYALRCELGIGDINKIYIRNAKQRAQKIYTLLFPKNPDVIFFDHWIYDPCCDDPEVLMPQNLDVTIMNFKDQLFFLSQMQKKYRCTVLRNLPFHDNFDESDISRRNRIICYIENNEANFLQLVESQLKNTIRVNFVSFENECIYSIYDDRGCDIVFATKEKMKEFYPKHEPYFLDYDREEMKKRIVD